VDADRQEVQTDEKARRADEHTRQRRRGTLRGHGDWGLRGASSRRLELIRNGRKPNPSSPAFPLSRLAEPVATVFSDAICAIRARRKPDATSKALRLLAI